MKTFRKTHILFSNKFFHTIVVAFFAAFAIPVLCSIFMLLFNESSVVKELYKSDEIMCSAVSSYLESEISSVSPLVSSISSSESFAKLNEYNYYVQSGTFVKDCYNMASILKKYIKAPVEDIYVVFNNSDIVVTPNSFEKKDVFFQKNLADSGYDCDEWKDLVKQNVYEYYYAVEDGEGKYLDFFFNPGFFETRECNAMIILRISVNHFIDYYSKIYNLDYKEILIIDKNNQVLLKQGEKVLPDLKYNDILEKKKFQDDGKYCYISDISSYNKWKTIVATDKKYVNNYVFYTKMLSYMNILIYLIFTLALFFFFIVKNYLPIKKIIKMLGGKVDDEYDFIENTISEYRFDSMKYRRQMEDNEKDKFYDSLLSMKMSKEVFLKKAASAGITFGSEYFVVLLFDVYNYDEMFKNEQESYEEISDIDLVSTYRFVIKNIFEEILSEAGSCHIISKNGKMTAVVNFSEFSDNWESELKELITRGKNFIEDKFNFFFNVNISNAVCGTELVANAYNEVRLLNKNSKFMRHKEIFFISDLLTDNETVEYDNDISDKLTFAIQVGDEALANALIENTVNTFYEKNSISTLKFFSIKSLNAISEILPSEARNTNVFSTIVNSILEFESYDKYLKLYRELIKFVCDAVQNEKHQEDFDEKSERDMVNQIKEYIEQVYSDCAIGVAHIGRHLGITPYYASRVFKEKTGENLSDYISRFRIEKAKELINEQDKLSISKLHSMVGFGSEITFMRAFKKHEKITVSQYKKMIGKK